MPSQDDPREKRLSRRRFVESAAALAAVGVVGLGLEDVAGPLLRRRAENAAADPATPVPRAANAWNESRTIVRGETGTPTLRGESASNPTSPIGPALSTADKFSIFWITDTQFLSESNPALFRMVTNWIVNNWKTFNGKLVIHSGDIVEHGGVQAEWANANEAMSILLNNGIPYTWCAGNHDDLVNGDPTSGWTGTMWAPAFDPSVVSAQVNSLQYASWAGTYHGGMNNAVAFSVNDLNFLVVSLEWNAQPAVLKWVEGLLDTPEYAGYRVIIAPHAYMDETGDLDDAKWGPTLAEFVGGLTPLMNSHSSNVFLTLNGHFATDCGYNTPSPVNGRNQLMFDRQDSLDVPKEPTGRGADNACLATYDSDMVGSATVAVLTFDTSNNLISVKTYDVYAGQWRTDSYEDYTVAMLPTPVIKSQVAQVAPAVG